MKTEPLFISCKQRKGRIAPAFLFCCHETAASLQFDEFELLLDEEFELEFELLFEEEFEDEFELLLDEEFELLFEDEFELELELLLELELELLFEFVPFSFSLFLKAVVTNPAVEPCDAVTSGAGTGLTAAAAGMAKDAAATAVAARKDVSFRMGLLLLYERPA